MEFDMPSIKGLYESVTETIIAELEKGVRPWTAAWKTTGKGVSIMPTNASTNRPYSGMNILLLWGVAISRGYPSHGWMTFKQANALSGRVRKGEKAATAIYTSFKEKEEDGKTRTYPMVKAYSVFNLAQLEGLPEAYYATPEPWPEEAQLEGLRNLLSASGIRVQWGAHRPAYLPLKDLVEMPNHKDFATDDDFASTLGHELIHATGHASRLDRKFSEKLRQENYGLEELVAELGSAFLCAHLGFSYLNAQTPAYLDGWLKVLKQDARAIFSMASYASHAADWLREREHAVVDENDPDESARKAAQAPQRQEQAKELA
jgi:antirestriction protein ArdC